MKHFIFIVFTLLASQISLSFDFEKPLFSPQKAIDLAINHLSNVEKIDKGSYEISGVSFVYYANTSGKTGYRVLLECKPTKNDLYSLSCFSSLHITNEENPKIRYIPGT